MQKEPKKIPKPRVKGPSNARMYQDLPEFADRISIVGHHNRTGRMKNFTHEKLKQRLARTDVLQKEWQEALEHEYKDRSPYNYPLFGVEKYV